MHPYNIYNWIRSKLIQNNMSQVLMLVQLASSKGANLPPQDPDQNWFNSRNRVSWDPGEAQSYAANQMPGTHWWPNQPSAEPSAPK